MPSSMSCAACRGRAARTPPSCPDPPRSSNPFPGRIAGRRRGNRIRPRRGGRGGRPRCSPRPAGAAVAAEPADEAALQVELQPAAARGVRRADRAGQDDLVAGRHRPGQRRPRPVVERQVGAAFRRPPVVAEPDFMQARGPPRLASDIADLQPPFLDAGGRRVLGPGHAPPPALRSLSGFGSARAATGLASPPAAVVAACASRLARNAARPSGRSPDPGRGAGRSLYPCRIGETRRTGWEAR